MNFQNLLKHFFNFGNPSNFGGFGNFGNQQCNQENYNQYQQTNSNNENINIYPESFTTSDFKENLNNSCSNGSRNIGENSKFNTQQSFHPQFQYNNPQFQQNQQFQGNNQQFQGNNQQNSFLNGLLGPNFNIASLAPFFSLFNKNKNASTFNMDSLPDDMKGLASLIKMFSTPNDKKRENTIIIDDFKKIDS